MLHDIESPYGNIDHLVISGGVAANSRLRALAESAGLDPVFAEKFLNFVIAEVIRHHEQLQNTD